MTELVHRLARRSRRPGLSRPDQGQGILDRHLSMARRSTLVDRLCRRGRAEDDVQITDRLRPTRAGRRDHRDTAGPLDCPGARRHHRQRPGAPRRPGPRAADDQRTGADDAAGCGGVADDGVVSHHDAAASGGVPDLGGDPDDSWQGSRPER